MSDNITYRRHKRGKKEVKSWQCTCVSIGVILIPRHRTNTNTSYECLSRVGIEPATLSARGKANTKYAIEPV